MSHYQAAIGIEVHVQLNTTTKLFCGCSTKFDDLDNQNTCPICLGLPGSLPSINKAVIQKAILLGKTLNCKINRKSVFERKNYFYPDLPKGYQISQYKLPILKNGMVKYYAKELHKINITRIHIEEDAGKLVHLKEFSLLNFNRAGIPLLEIVSEPEISSPSKAASYAKAIRDLVVYLGICDGNLEEGSLRFDLNVSIRNEDNSLGVKVELKNLNSFRFIDKALEYEIARQSSIIDRKGEIVQETRLYDSAADKTISMRTKEDSEDYRYFPDPDLIPIKLSEDDLNIVVPEPQVDKIEEFLKYTSTDDAIGMTKTPELADSILNLFRNFKNISWATDLLCTVAKRDDRLSKINKLKKLIGYVNKKEISIRSAKIIFESVLEGQDLEKLVREKKQLSDKGKISEILKSLIIENKSQWDEYINGKDKVREFFVGKVMQKTKGSANPGVVVELIESLKTK